MLLRKLKITALDFVNFHPMIETGEDMDTTTEKSIAKRRREINSKVDHGIRAVCFDLDGVLVDAAEWHEEALNRALTSVGYRPIGKKEHLKTFNGLSTYRKLEMLTTMSRISRSYSHKFIYDKKQEKTIEIIEEKCKPVQRIIDTVERANLIFNNDVAVVTNCSRYTAELMLEKSGLLHLFKFIVTNEDVKGHIKPSPWPYMLAQEKLGLKGPKKVLAIDDTGRGISSAIDARCRTWFLNNFEDLTPGNLVNVINSYRITL